MLNRIIYTYLLVYAFDTLKHTNINNYWILVINILLLHESVFKTGYTCRQNKIFFPYQVGSMRRIYFLCKITLPIKFFFVYIYIYIYIPLNFS